MSWTQKGWGYLGIIVAARDWGLFSILDSERLWLHVFLWTLTLVCLILKMLKVVDLVGYCWSTVIGDSTKRYGDGDPGVWRRCFFKWVAYLEIFGSKSWFSFPKQEVRGSKCWLTLLFSKHQWWVYPAFVFGKRLGGVLRVTDPCNFYAKAAPTGAAGGAELKLGICG